eukprot:16176597-Heterocapsa_arctica.AAC.1
MGTQAGQAWAKAMYMASVGNDGRQPWASSHAWTDGQPWASSNAGNLPHDARPSRKEATYWLRPRD